MNAYGKIRAIKKLRDMGIPVPGDASGREVADLINMVKDRPIAENWESVAVIIERFLADPQKPGLQAMTPLKPQTYPPGVMERIQSFRQLKSLYE
jgi:hypothetical protein